MIELLYELSGRYALLIVHVGPTQGARPALGQVADATVAIGSEREIEIVRRTRLPAQREVIVLSESATSGLEGERRRLTEACRATVLRVVHGGSLPLTKDGVASDGEPWRSVDWLARHFLQRRVGLALGAGGAKGYAHLGVLEALAQTGVPIDYFAGTSIGAPLASGAALEMPVPEMRYHMDEIFRPLARPRLPWRSVRSAGALRGNFDRLCDRRLFEDLARPLSIVAADLDRREEFSFRQGPLSDAILASIAIPAVYPPVHFEGRRLVDGALLNPVPTSTLVSAGADIVIGVKLTPPAAAQHDRPRGGWSARFRPPIVETVLRAFDVMQWKITAEGASRADVTIEPTFQGATGLRDYRRADECIESGRAAVEAALPRLRSRLALGDFGGSLERAA